MGPQRIKKTKKDKNVFKKLEDAGGLSSWVQPGAKGKGSEEKDLRNQKPQTFHLSYVYLERSNLEATRISCFSRGWTT